MVHMYCKCSANVLQHVYYADPAEIYNGAENITLYW